MARSAADGERLSAGRNRVDTGGARDEMDLALRDAAPELVDDERQ